MQARAHTAGTVFLDLLEEDLQHVVARHGGERVSEQGTLISADERGMAEVLSLLALLVQKCVYLLYWYKSTKYKY
jgi:hypothetical protein